MHVCMIDYIYIIIYYKYQYTTSVEDYVGPVKNKLIYGYPSPLFYSIILEDLLLLSLNHYFCFNNYFIHF